MYTTIIAIFIALFYYFGSGFINTIYNASPSINVKINYSSIGFTWFISLLIVNVIILIFIIGFYYYKQNTSNGPTGPRGLPGIQGYSSPDCHVCNN